MDEIKTGMPNAASAVDANFKELQTKKAENSASTNFLGNAATATKLKIARSISISGDVSGSANFDGSVNAGITATLASVSQTNTTSTQTATDGGTIVVVDKINVDGKGRVTGVNTKSATLPPTQTSITGNAGSSTKLQTARNINGVAFDGTKNIDINPSVTTIADNADLNNYKTVGFYSGAKLSGIKNTPTGSDGSWFTLLVQNIGTSNAFQVYFETNTARLYVRKLSDNTTWGKWNIIADSNGLVLETRAVNNQSNYFQSTELTTWNTTQLMGKYFIPAWQWLDFRPYTEGAYMVEISGNYNQWIQEAKSFDYTKEPLYRTFDGSTWTEWRKYKN